MVFVFLCFCRLFLIPAGSVLRFLHGTPQLVLVATPEGSGSEANRWVLLKVHPRTGVPLLVLTVALERERHAGFLGLKKPVSEISRTKTLLFGSPKLFC